MKLNWIGLYFPPAKFLIHSLSLSLAVTNVQRHCHARINADGGNTHVNKAWERVDRVRHGLWKTRMLSLPLASLNVYSVEECGVFLEGSRVGGRWHGRCEI